MRRRDVLAAIAGSGSAVGLAGVVGGAGAGSAVESGDRHVQDAYEPIGTVDLAGTRELSVGEDGSVGYVAVDDGIATLDLSDPAEPRVLAERRELLEDEAGGPLQLIWDAWPDGDRLLAAGPAQNLPGSDLNAALLFDVADPADPQLLDSHRTSFPIHNCFFEEGTAYLTGNGAPGNPLVILDAGGDELAEVGRWSLLDYDDAWANVFRGIWQLHDVYVQDDVAYLPYWDAGTYLLDVSDPAEPTALGHTSHYTAEEAQSAAVESGGQTLTIPPGNAHYVQVDETGDLMAVGREAWAVRRDDCVAGGPGGIDLYDVSDPGEIVHQATIDAPASYSNSQDGQFTTSHNLDIVSDRLYSSWYFGGVKVHDVGDPENPEELAWWRSPGETSFWTAQSAVPGEHFVAASADDAAGYGDGIAGRIYVFPDRAGEQPDPPSLEEPPAEFESLPNCEDVQDTGSGTDETGTGEQSDDGGSDDGGAGSGSGDGDADGTGTDSDDGDDENSVPGFGIAAAVGGLGIAAARLRRRERS